jgi:hypothetical protein
LAPIKEDEYEEISKKDSSEEESKNQFEEIKGIFEENKQ